LFWANTAKEGSVGFRQLEGVAQTSPGLPGCRGFPIRSRDQAGTACRLEVGDTAGWKHAPRASGARYRFKTKPFSVNFFFFREEFGAAGSARTNPSIQ
jgi:hypothetical protein